MRTTCSFPKIRCCDLTGEKWSRGPWRLEMTIQCAWRIPGQAAALYRSFPQAFRTCLGGQSLTSINFPWDVSSQQMKDCQCRVHCKILSRPVSAGLLQGLHCICCPSISVLFGLLAPVPEHHLQGTRRPLAQSWVVRWTPHARSLFSPMYFAPS